MGRGLGEAAHGWPGNAPKKLIEAVVNTVRGIGPPPMELRVGWQCLRYNCLPETGAYLDQDATLIYRMTACLNIHSALSHYQGAMGAAIHMLDDDERRILKLIKDLGLYFNAGPG